MAVRGSVTPELWARSFDNLKPAPGLEAAISACKALAKGEIKWLLLAGDVGCGKTHLAVATARLFDDLRAQIVADTIVYMAKIEWWSVPDLLEQHKGSWKEDEESPLNRCRSADFVVLDDLGLEPPPETSLWKSLTAELVAMLDYRYRARLPVLVTTNLSSRELDARYGRRLLSRFLELGSIIHIEAPDYRAVGEIPELEPCQPVFSRRIDMGEEVRMSEWLEMHKDSLSVETLRSLQGLFKRMGWDKEAKQVGKYLEGER